MKFLVRLSRLRHLCRICAAALLLSGCATTGTMDGGTGESPPKTAGEEVKEPVRPEAGEAETLPAVVAVSVVGDGDALFIETTGSTKHTVFRLTEPPRLVIDMPGVDVSAVDSPMTVDNPYMTEITASSYGEGAGRIGRISIGLRPGVEYEITSGDRSILVSLTGGVEPAAAAEAAAAEAEAVPAGEAVPAEKAVSAKEAAPVAAAGSPPPASRAGFGPAEVVEGAFRKEETAGEAAAADDIPEAAATPGQAAAGPAPAAPADAGPSAPEAGPEPQSPAAPPPAAPPPAPQATTLTAVERTRVGEESVFTIRADGVIGNYNAFSLDDPARIVVDIWGVDSAIGHYRIEYDDPYVKAMRIGRHPDKVRFVFDAGDEGSLPGYIAEKSGEVVTVRFMSPGRAERLKPTSVAAYGPGSAAAATEAEGVPALEAVSAKEAAPVAAAESPPPAPSAGFGPAEVVEGAFKKEETVEEAAASGEPVPAPRVDTGPVVAGFGPGVESVVSVPPRPTAGPGSEAAATEAEGVPAEKAVSAREAVPVREAVSAKEAAPVAAAESPPPAPSAGFGPAEVVEGAFKKEETVEEAAASGEPVPAPRVDTGPVVAGFGPGVESVVSIPPRPTAGPGSAAAATEAEAVPAKKAVPVREAVSAKEAAPAAAAAPAPKPAAPPAASKAASFEDKTMAVKDVRFERLRDTARVVVEGSRRPRYRVTESLGGRKITVDFDGAVIPKALERTLDATKLGTPVLKISSYQAMTEPEKRVRLLIFVRQKVPYDILEDRGNLYIDFPLAGPPVEEAAAGVKTPVGEGAPSAEAAEAAEAGGAGGDAEGAERRYTGRRIDIDMVDANISDVLKLLAEVSNLNIITGDDVVGTITLRLKNVPWDQAFDIILRTKNLDKVQEGNIIWVAPADKIKQEKAAALEAKQAEEKLEELKIHLIPVNYATASDLLSQVREVMSERGTVTSEDRTNTLIIKDIQKSIDAARELVARLDTPIPQVLIEARIVEASTSFARDLGVQWGIDYKNLTDSVLTHSFGTTATTGLTTQNYAVSLPATGTAGSLGGIGLTIGKLAKNPLLLDLSLSAGEQSGLLKTISRPRITTLDNREAVIEQGEEIPFETTSATGTATTFKKANLSLTVTPHITPDGSVLMKIKATRNSLGTFRTQSGEPSINTKEASTEVLVRDGETTVIGGIIISDSSRTTKGIPFMKDIPLLGWLFKSKSVSDSQSELLIFITPKIVKSHGS